LLGQPRRFLHEDRCCSDEPAQAAALASAAGMDQGGMSMAGRRPTGPSCVRKLPGSDLAKTRLEVILETIAGQKRVVDACAELDISEPRYHQLKDEVLRGALQALEPRPMGRPPATPSPEQQQIVSLHQQLRDKDLELRAAQARAEIAVTLPRLVQDPATPEKKTTTQTRRRSTRGSKKST
jgi:hypothetical protein